MDRTPPGRASSTSDDRARATGRNRTLLTRYQGLAKAPDYVAALFADISMRSDVALTQAAKADDAATRALVANRDRKRVVQGKRVLGRVDFGGRSILTKKK